MGIGEFVMKFCIDCKHIIEITGRRPGWDCAKRKLVPDMVTGETKSDINGAKNMRIYYGNCGREANFFEAK
jgi:hypothetical protein